MPNLRAPEILSLAELGAAVRFRQLAHEQQRIARAFPRAVTATVPPVRRKKPAPRKWKMSLAKRQEASERMTRLWAERRKAKGVKAKR